MLAVQGNFREHAAMLRRLGAEVVEVRKPEQLDGLDGLVIPGGESTAFTRLMRLYGLDEAIRRFEAPVFGTCAGMIVLDRDHLGLVDLAVTAKRVRPPGRLVRERPRGRRARASRCARSSSGRRGSRRSVPGVEVLAELDGHPVLAREGRFLVASFHPELTDDTRLHELFLESVEEGRLVRA